MEKENEGENKMFTEIQNEDGGNIIEGDVAESENLNNQKNGSVDIDKQKQRRENVLFASGFPNSLGKVFNNEF